MKTLLAFFAGSLTTTIAVVLAGGYHAGMVILGGILTVLALTAAVWALGIPRVSRWLLAFHSANSETVYPVRRANAGKPLAVADRPRRAPTTQNRQNVVTLPKVLAQVQQDVLSALVNIQMPFSQAERAVLDCYKPGDSFDDLFKRTIPARRSA